MVDHLLLLVLEGEEADVAGDELRRRIGLLVLGEHQDRRGLHGPADVHGILSPGEVLEVRDRLADRRVRRAVEDDAERALVVVLAHQHDRPDEVRVLESRARDQQAASQGVHPRPR